MKNIPEIGYNITYEKIGKEDIKNMEDFDLKELFSIFWNRKNYILLIVAISMVVGIIYSYFFVKPKYKSQTSLLLAQSNINAQEQEGIVGDVGGITTNDVTLNQKLVPTYSVLLKSDSIINEVVDNLNIDVSAEQLKNSITVSAVKDTQLINITVTAEAPRNAKVIADEISKVFIEKIAHDIYKMDNVTIIDSAKEDSNPYNINHTKDIIMFTAIGIVIAIVYVLIANMLDTTVKSQEDIEKKLGLSVISSIPLYNFNASMKPVSKGGRR